MVNINFNSAEVEPSTFGEVIPAGEYVVAIKSSDHKTTKDGDGAYLNFMLQVLDGPYKGRTVFDMLNLWNTSEKTVIIAKGRLSEYCRACGRMGHVADSSELHDKPITVKIGIAKSEGYEDKNVIKKVLWKESTKPNTDGILGASSPKAAALNDEPPF